MSLTASLMRSALSLCALRSNTMMFVLDFPLVSPGKCGQPVYLTSALVAPTPPSPPFFLSSNTQFNLITSQGYPCTTERGSAHAGRRSQRGHSSAPLNRRPVIYCFSVSGSLPWTGPTRLQVQAGCDESNEPSSWPCRGSGAPRGPR